MSFCNNNKHNKKNLLNNYNTTISFQYHFLNYITPTTAVLFAAAALKSPPLPPTIFLLIRKTCKPNFAVVYLCYIVYVCVCLYPYSHSFIKSLLSLVHDKLSLMCITQISAGVYSWGNLNVNVICNHHYHCHHAST